MIDYTAKCEEACKAVFDATIFAELRESAFMIVLKDMLARDSGARLYIREEAKELIEQIRGYYYPTTDEKGEDDGSK